MGFSLSSAFPQTIYVNLDIIEKKVEKGKETSEVFKKRFIETGLFIPAGEKQIKYRVHQEISNAQIEEFTALLSELATEIREKRLKEAE